MNFRLQSRHTLTLLGVLAIALAVLSGTLLYEFRSLTRDMQNASSEAISNALQEDAKEAGISFGKFLATAMRTPIYQLDFASIGRLAESALAQQGVTYVYVFDSEGRVVHDGTLSLQSYGHRIDNPDLRLVLESAQTSTVFVDELLRVTVPVVIGEEVHGGVRIGLSTEEIQNAIASAAKLQTSIGEHGFAQILSAALSVTMLLGIIGVIVSMKLAQNLTQPIKVLSDLAHRIGRGEYDIEVPIDRRDEVGDLALSFKEMAEELARAAHRNTLLATFVEHVDDAIEYTNPAHERITGYTLAEAIGRSPAVLHRPKVHDPAIYTNIEHTSEAGQTWKGNMLGQRKDGSLWHQNATISPIHNEKGEITHFIAIKRDVTADIERQQALAESEQRFKDFAEAASDWLWEMDEDLRFVAFTGNEPNIGGRTIDDAVGKTRWELFDVDPDEDEYWRQHKADLEACRPFRDVRYEFHADNGKTFYLSASGKPIFDEDGEFKGYRGTACDMTIQVESEIARRQSEELLASIVTNLPGRVFRRVLHSDGSMTYPYVGSGNEATPTFSWEKRVFDSEEAVRHVHPDDRSMWRAALDRSARNLEPYDFEFRRILPAGDFTWVRYIGRPHKLGNDDIIWDGISLDVTDKKLAESALDASERTRAAMLEAIPDPLFSHDINGVFLDFHSSIEFETLVPPDKFLGRTIREVMPADLADKSMVCIEKAVKTGRTQFLEYPLEINGKTYFYEARYVSSGNDEILAVVRDVTDRKQAEDALKASEARFRRLVENATDSFFLHDLEGNTVDVNQHAADALGYTRDELLSLSIGDVEIGRHDQSLRTMWEKLKSGKPMTATGIHRRKDGTTFPVDVRLGSLEVDGRPHVLALARDTTERDRVQRQLAHTSKMATLGEMGAGIAHELNQPLQIIRIAADHCMAMLDNGASDLKKMSSRLRRISDQTGRMSQIIDHMRVLSRRDDVPKELLNPANCATAAIVYASNEFRQAKVPVSTKFPDRCTPVIGHSVQLEQAILNLLTNAKDAILATHDTDNSGRKNGRKSGGHVEVTVKDDKASGRVKIIVADDGGGIPDEIVDRIFDPFFTTKEVGVGTGLGFSVSYGFVNAMGGSIDVRNTKKGAEFTISLAAVESSGSQLDTDLSAAE